MYCGTLTKEMLLHWGIKDIKQLEDGTWLIKRIWYRSYHGKNSFVEKTIQVSQAPRKHTYADTKYYPVVNFSFNRKPISITLNRLLYAWFEGPIPEGLCVGPDYDNPGKLKLKTVEEAQADRYLVNDKIKNQWFYIYGRK